MKETYDIIIEKLKRDKLEFERDIKEVIDDVENNELSKIYYERASGKKVYCDELIEFFTEVRDNL